MEVDIAHTMKSEEEVDKRMAKRLLRDDNLEGGSFHIEEIEYDNYQTKFEPGINQWTKQPAMESRITVKMRPINDSTIEPSHYVIIRLGN